MTALIRFARRFVLMLGGEVAQSIFHFALNILLARTMSPHDYGRFAIVFLVGGLGLTYVRALAGVPAGIFIPGRAGRRTALGFEVSFGSAAMLLSGAMGLGVGVTLWIASDIAPLAAGLFVGLWGLRSYVRGVLLTKRMALASGLGDLVFALSGTALTALLMRREGTVGLDAILAVLALANALGIVASLLALRQPVRVNFGRTTRRRYRALWPSLSWSLVGTTTANLQGQGQSLLVAFLAGPAAYAPIAATFVLFAPLRLTTSALINMVQPDIAGHLAAGRIDRAKRVALRCLGLMAASGLAYGGVVLGFLPLIENRLFADRFADAPMTLIALCAWAIVGVSLLHAPFRVVLEMQQAFRKLAFVAAVSAVAGGIVVVVLLFVAAPAWSLLGVLLSECVVLVYCGFTLRPWRRAGTRRGAIQAGDPLPIPNR
jgi:O-antigen/teichoic acid export membrane protein